MSLIIYMLKIIYIIIICNNIYFFIFNSIYQINKSVYITQYSYKYILD